MRDDRVNGQRIRCYDNGGSSMDRYTVAYLDTEVNGTCFGVGMSEHPYHPQGFGQHTDMKLGRHLGKRIAFKSLPPDCQKLVESDMEVEE